MLTKGFIFSSLVLALSAFNAYAAPVEAEVETAQLEKRQSIAALSASQVSTYKPYTYFASAAYCNPTQTKAWNCGGGCTLLSKLLTA